MQLIELQKIPNQTLTVALNNIMYRISIRTIQDLTFMSVWKNDDILFYNQVCVPNAFVNPYNYVSSDGKLYFKCIDNEYPNYKKFGNTQKLFFLTTDEIARL